MAYTFIPQNHSHGRALNIGWSLNLALFADVYRCYTSCATLRSTVRGTERRCLLQALHWTGNWSGNWCRCRCRGGRWCRLSKRRKHRRSRRQEHWWVGQNYFRYSRWDSYFRFRGPFTSGRGGTWSCSCAYWTAVWWKTRIWTYNRITARQARRDRNPWEKKKKLINQRKSCCFQLTTPITQMQEIHTSL